jgi:hypothetical protein
MAQVVDAITAPLEHFELGVQPFDKTAALPLVEVVGNQVQPPVQEFEEGIVAGQAARLDLPAPGLNPTYPCGFGTGRIKDLTQLLTKLVGQLELRAVGKQTVQMRFLLSCKIGLPFAERPEG